ncbi:MAG TPA: choice-of-anchor tandem repeat GloVer-containing protein [Tepidisphaeraceae bacterium]
MVNQSITRGIAIVCICLLLQVAWAPAAVVYSYVALPSTVISTPGSTATVEIYLQETLSGSSNSLVAADGGLFNAGVSVSAASGMTASIVSGSDDSSFGGPGLTTITASAASFLEGTAITDLSGPEGTVAGAVRDIPLASISIHATKPGETVFDIGEYNTLGGNTLDFAGNDLDIDSTDPAYKGAGDGFTTLIVYTPEPLSGAASLAAMGVYASLRKRRRPRQNSYHIDSLEKRTLLSAALLNVPTQITGTPSFVEEGLVPIARNLSTALTSTLSAPFTASQIRQAYGVNGISFFGNSGDGTGQTIAVVDAYNDPNIVFDADYFSSVMGLPQFNANGGPTLNVVNQYGQSTVPDNATAGTWDIEESIDVEWAHAIAPKANIVLFEANSSDLADLMQAVDTARNYPGVDVVNMSWGGSEFEGEQQFDSYFTTPAGHQGVTFVGSSGDAGGLPQFPETSPNVIGVGATSLTINSAGTYASESAWPDSGGGVSYYQQQPSYQAGKVNEISATNRTSPDVSMDGDPVTGVYVLDTFYNDSSFLQIGGTSLASPMWAGLIAIADQGKMLGNQSSLDGATMTLPTLYQLPASNFHDVTSGSNGFAAGPGYDLATGLGTPIANLLVAGLAGYQPASHLAFTSTALTSATAGVSLPQITVNVEDASGNTVTADHSQVMLTVTGPNGVINSDTKTVTAVNGVATISNLVLTQAGNYYLTATDGSLSRAVSGSFTVVPAAASKLVFIQPPTNIYVTAPFIHAVIVAVEDAYNNFITNVNSTVSLSVNSGPGSMSGTTNATTNGGVATFSNLSFATPGDYTLKASDGSLPPLISNSFSVTGDQLVFATKPGDSVINTALAPITVSIEKADGSVDTSSNASITIAIDTGPAGGTMSGITTVNAVNGVVTFNNLTLSQHGTYILMAYNPDILTGASAYFQITGRPSQIAYTPEPTNAIAGVPAYPNIAVSVEDLYGATVPNDTSMVTLSIASGPQGAYLDGTTQVAAADGVATFSDLIFSEPGTYTLKAIDGNLPSIVSTSITASVGGFSLQSLGSLDGNYTIGSLISDSAGDLFGVTNGSVNTNAPSNGTLFEIPAGTKSAIPLASFPATVSNLEPSGTLAIDAHGDLFGTTEFGGSDDQGTIFELAKGSTTINFLASTDGSYPLSGVIIDSAGNLYGTTASGGEYDSGTVFELPANSSSVQTLASIGGVSGGDTPFGGLYRDSTGNLFGTTEFGGDFNAGTIYEVTSAGVYKTIISLAGPDGEYPTNALVADAQGNLYGTTYQGGTYNDGTLFELSQGHITTLVNFTGENGSLPYAGLVMDGNGNLFGTTLHVTNDQNGDGIVYELPHGASSIVMLADFNQSAGEWPYGAMTFGPDGNLYGITDYGGAYGGGSVYELQVPSLTPAISANGGAAQRSMDNLVTVKFPQAVALVPGAISIAQQLSGGTSLPMNVALNSPDGGLTWNITFPSYTGGSLPDGNYDLTIIASDVTAIATNMQMTGGNQTFTFYRLFGDIDGNGTVDQSDYTAFMSSYGQTSGGSLYNPAFDYDGNGIINGSDYLQFKKRFGTSIQS